MDIPLWYNLLKGVNILNPGLLNICELKIITSNPFKYDGQINAINEVNDLLGDNWKLLEIYTTYDTVEVSHQNQFIHYVLGIDPESLGRYHVKTGLVSGPPQNK